MISDSNDFKYIKKHYGENFAKLCRELFPTILEHEGMLSKIITESFTPNPYLYSDLSARRSEFRKYINSKSNLKIPDYIETGKTPEKLLDEAGYILYPECLKPEDIEKFKKYYTEDEEICTFCDEEGRLETCRVWFAVKKNVRDIKRENFKIPQRQDEYGTSVISIQFTRENECFVSIKNRYNHKVNNPDNTFNNNLDNIIPGLTRAFENSYEIKINTTENDKSVFKLPGYIKDMNGRFHKVLHKEDDYDHAKINYYCANNMLISYNDDDEAQTFDSIKKFDDYSQILTSGFVIDLKNKKIIDLNDENPSFVNSIGEIENIKVTIDSSKNKIVTIAVKNGENVVLTLDRANGMIGYINPNITKIGEYFLSENKSLRFIDLQNITQVGNAFLAKNTNMVELNMPNLVKTGNRFLAHAVNLQKLDLPKLESVEYDFLKGANHIENVYLPSLLYADDNFMLANENAKIINLPKIKTVGSNFFEFNYTAEKVNMPKLETIGDKFMFNNYALQSLSLPSLKICGNKFINGFCATNLKKVDLPKLEECGNGFLENACKIKSMNLPNLKSVGDGFMSNAYSLKQVSVPKLTSVKEYFLSYTSGLEKLKISSGFPKDKYSKLMSSHKNLKVEFADAKVNEKVF